MAKKDVVLITTSRCKGYLKEKHGLRAGADALEQLNAKVRQLLNVAAQRAEQDRRQTVKARDIEL